MKGGKIDHEQIGFLTNIESSNRLGLAERARTSGGREMERFPDAQRCDIRLIKRAQRSGAHPSSGLSEGGIESLKG